jgi:hypothetical protein
MPFALVAKAQICILKGVEMVAMLLVFAIVGA